METVSIREAQHNLSAVTREDKDTVKRKADWSAARERIEAYWKDRPFIGRSMAEIVSEGRGDR